MQKQFLTLLAVGSLALGMLQAQAQTTELRNYVNQCRTSLGFQDTDIPATIDCYDGVLFDVSDPEHDYVGYRRVTDQVDLTFACRWLGGSKADRRTAVSIELMLHNRQNGNTCVFSGRKVQQFSVPSLMTGPTASTASSYWITPTQVAQGEARCVGCHVSGPYISTPLVAPVLAKYGLLNNGHDTLSNMSFDDLTAANPNVHAKYHFVGSAFSDWDRQRNTFVGTGDSSCSQGCHLIGTNTDQGSVVIAPAGTVLANPVDYLNKIFDAGVMPPWAFDSHYRWINLDTSGDGVEAENFASAIGATTTLIPNITLPVQFDGNGCPTGNVPSDMEAHAVGVDVENSFAYSSVTWFTEKLRSFNLKDGVVCLNADQDPGVSCRDFDASYLCPSGNWTGFFNHQVNSGGGDDHEERSFSNNAIVAACGNQQPVGVKARIFVPVRGGQSPQIVIGPNDRLARLSQYGLTCNTADQPDGKCSNYVVRYQGCNATPVTVNRRLSSVFTGKVLTASSSSSGAAVKGQPLTPAWNTQEWALEPVANTEYVRLKNTGTNTYLNVTSSTEQTIVVTSTSSTAVGQRWIVEPVTFSSDFRLKNLGSGKYLTVQDPARAGDPNFLAVYSQGKNPGWTSQRWVIN